MTVPPYRRSGSTVAIVELSLRYGNLCCQQGNLNDLASARIVLVRTPIKCADWRKLMRPRMQRDEHSFSPNAHQVVV